MTQSRTFAIMLPCDSITPFGSPVVPEVYMMVAKESGLIWESRLLSSFNSVLEGGSLVMVFQDGNSLMSGSIAKV